MKKLSYKNLGIIIALLFFDLFLVGYVKLESKIVAQKAFLAKHGEKFVVAYKDRDENVGVLAFDSLEEALRNLKELRLEMTPSLASFNFPMEHAWLRKDIGKTVLYWKFSGREDLNKITFQSEKDAEFFASAFKQGAYSPSPLGHSLYFLPTKTKDPRNPFVGKLVDSLQAGLSF